MSTLFKTHTRSKKRTGLLLLLVAMVAMTVFAEGQQPATTPTPVWRTTPATPSGVIQRIEDAAIKYQDSGAVPRTVFYDIGYPASDEELTALDGHAVVLLTALSQSREELPLQRAFIVLEDKTEVPLKQLKLVLSEQSNSTTLATKVFGRYRGDALYLLPVYLRTKPVDLMVEFAGSGARLKVATFGSGVSNAVLRLKIAPPTGIGPTEAALNAFMKREFPGF